MKTYICPDCGKTFESDTLPTACPDCGCPFNLFKAQNNPISSPNATMQFSNLSANLSPSLESGNNFHAEHVINGLATVGLWAGIIIGVAAVIAGIVIWATWEWEGEMIGPIVLGAGVIFFFCSLVFWAVLKLLVNISYRLTRLDNKANPQ